MTDKQWIFTYLQIKKAEEERDKKEREDKIILYKQIRLAGLSGHPNVDAKKSIELVDKIRLPGEKTNDEEIREAMAFIEQNKDMFPEDIIVTKEDKKKSNAPKGRLDRKLGIIITE